MTKKAFTLIELLVVIAIIGILAGILISSMVSATNSANDAKRKADINQLVKSIMIAKISNTTLPADTANCSIGSTCSGIQSLLTNTIPKDPNGNYYTYNRLSDDDFTISASMSSGTYVYNSSLNSYTSNIPLNGQCGTSDSTITLTSPSNTCSAGTASSITTDSNTVLLMHMDGTNNGTTFLDQTNKTITRSGDTKTITATNKFGTASAYFDGTGDYLSLADSDDWNFGSGDFTIDFWIKRTRMGVTEYFIGQDTSTTSASNFAWAIYVYSNNRIDFSTAIGSNYYSVTDGTINISDTNWHHLAMVRSGTNLYGFVDGQLAGSKSNLVELSLNNSTSPLLVARSSYAPGFYFIGNIDELRISKGIARWTTNFTPPATQYYWWNWSCNGIDGGNTATCGADKY